MKSYFLLVGFEHDFTFLSVEFYIIFQYVNATLKCVNSFENKFYATVSRR
jgi:hypothetical protein